MSEIPYEQLVQLPQVGITGPGPSELADLYSLRRDISFALECSMAYAAYADLSEEARNADAPAPQALWNAGAISYRRAFNSGRAHLVPKKSRFRLDENFLTSLTAEQRKTHEDVLNMASKHVAHRVGELEGAAATVFLAPVGHERGIAGVGSMSAHFVGPTAEFARALVDLCQAVLGALDEGIQVTSGALLASLQSTADLDDLYARAETPEA